MKAISTYFRILSAVAVVDVLLCHCDGQTFQELYSFSGGADGGGPQGALIQARDGNFYGTTGYGGQWTVGTVFRMTPDGALTTVASFDGTNGNYPYGALVEARDGNLYGTTVYGGRGRGNLFRVSQAGVLTLLGVFLGGAYPLGDLVQGPDDFLYGVTNDHGDYNSHGTIFRASTNGWSWDEMFIYLHLFYGDDGLYPSGGLLVASDRNFYGVTAGGGVGGSGTVFKINTNGDFSTAASFHGGPGSATWPLGKLLQTTDGSFYGAAGGLLGTIFKLTPGGVLTTFARFDGYTGEDPVGGLIQAHDEQIYGTAYSGGRPGYFLGTAFRLDIRHGCTNQAWTFCDNITTLGQFGYDAPGAYPYAGLLEGKDGNLYGTTAFGGSHGAGNIFRIIMPGNECRLTCLTNITVRNDPGQCGAVVNFGPPVTTNCAGYVITANPPSGSFFPAGTNTVTWTAIDSASGQLTNICTFLVIVRDCEPPVIQGVVASPVSLWPPNHKMQPVTLRVSGTDNCGSAHSKIMSVTSNEPGASDWQITDDLSLNLRAERSASGTGRVYTVTVQCADGSGNISSGQVRVAVPLSIAGSAARKSD